MENTDKIRIDKILGEKRSELDDIVTREFPLTIILNNEELVTLLCTPQNLKYLAIGYLASEGIINNKNEIQNITLDEKRGTIRVNTFEDKKFSTELVFKRVLTTGCGRGASFYSFADIREDIKIESNLTLTASQIFRLVAEFQRKSSLFQNTGGVHSAALCDSKSILIFADDIGRHNAVDKVLGEALWEQRETKDCILMTSGRISSEIVIKIARRNTPILISRSAPTDLGVKMAEQFGITLIGFARGHRMNIYTHKRRVINDPK